MTVGDFQITHFAFKNPSFTHAKNMTNLGIFGKLYVFLHLDKPGILN